MIYSSWRPDRGGYAYFQTAERRGIGNDLPTPRLVRSSPIGVASVEAGRPFPRGATPIGSGPLAKGVIVPLDRSGLSGGDDAEKIRMFFPPVAMFICGLLVGAWLRGARGAHA